MYNEETKATVGAQFNCANAMRSITVSTSRSLAALPQGFGKAGLLLATCLLYLAPAPAAWADNECVPVGVDPSATPGVADSYDCDQSSYPDGVTYAADGDLTVEFTLQDGTTEIEAGGIDLSAIGGDSIFFDSATTNTEIETRNTVGALLSVSTVDGNIDIDTEEVDADAHTPTDVTHGILATSTGAGSIDITTTDRVNARSGSNPDNSVGIGVSTNSGDIDITASEEVRGNMAAIDATTSTGNLTIDVGDDQRLLGNVHAVRADVGGDIEINVGTGARVVSPWDSTGGALFLTAAGTTTVNTAGEISAGGDRRGTVIIRAAGGAFTLNNDGEMEGTIDFTALTEGYTFNNNAGAVWDIAGIRETAQARQTGIPGVGPKVSELGAGTLNNAGTIDLGISSVSAPGTTYNATGDSVLDVDVFLDGARKTNCADIELVGGCLDLSGGTVTGQTSVLVRGRFSPLVTGPLAQVSSPNIGIVLVDVNGGNSQSDRFVLDPGSTLLDEAAAEGGSGEGPVSIYATDPVYGAVLDVGGIFDYALLYNPDTQQHLLASVPGPQAVEYASFVQQALSIWHTTTDAVAGRQADLRDRATGKVWFRSVGERTSRDATPTFSTQGNSFTYDRGYSLETAGAIVGFDAMAGDNHAAGVHIGLVSSSLEYDDSSTTDETKGATFGAYGGWWTDSGLSLDAAVNFNALSLSHSVPDYERSDTDVLSFGWRMEAGWRLGLSEALYVQPLITTAYTKSNIEEIELRDNTLSFEDSESLRSAIGARLGGDTALPDDSRIGFWATARAWEEHRGDGRVEFAVQQGDPLAIRDDLSGSFDEIGLGASFTTPGESLSVYFSGNRKSADQFNSYDISLGARFHW